MSDKRKIGIIDSGVGGLTVVKEFSRLLPDESIIYLGDNKNVPYGNKTEEEIISLTKKMIDFLIEKDVKLIAVACNTISSLLERYFLDSKIPIVSIINPATHYVNKGEFKSVGVVATRFTIGTNIYEELLNGEDKDLKVVSESIPTLAGLIDSGNYSEQEILDVIRPAIESILEQSPVEDIILGCTHYPIVIDKFKQMGPGINFINPAYEQTRYVKKILRVKDLMTKENHSSFEVYTSGKKETYIKMLEKLGIKAADRIYEIKEF
nr:glutamate racemase [Tissierella sp.]